MLPSKNWWDLRKKFLQSPPKQVSTDYLQSVLGVDVGAARNLVPPLRALGLIDTEGKPTDLANDWRSDEQYSGVCAKIFEKVYPQDLRDAFPPPGPPRAGVERWFMRNTGTGQAAARKMAALYSLLAQGDEKAQDTAIPAQKVPGATPKKQAKQGSKKQGVASRGVDREEPQALRPAEPPASGQASIPGLHIDIQVHIAADASSAQIDQVFASMARHLYGIGAR
jgi:hypothetical protein